DDFDPLSPAGTHVDDLRLTERDVRVAVVHVEVLDVLEVLVELRRNVEILFANPRNDVRRLHFLHLPAQAAVGEMRVADKLDRGDAGFRSLTDVEDDLLLARLEHVLGGRIDTDTLEP